MKFISNIGRLYSDKVKAILEEIKVKQTITKEQKTILDEFWDMRTGEVLRNVNRDRSKVYLSKRVKREVEQGRKMMVKKSPA